mmetsp:Transcript_17945/g.50593  ORF Transcript_17945/g.50593 Transcript_17945/m.50593 type:complete len:223 (+) Transcript_17945:359-1027(+)
MSMASSRPSSSYPQSSSSSMASRRMYRDSAVALRTLGNRLDKRARTAFRASSRTGWPNSVRWHSTVAAAWSRGTSRQPFTSALMHASSPAACSSSPPSPTEVATPREKSASSVFSSGRVIRPSLPLRLNMEWAAPSSRVSRGEPLSCLTTSSSAATATWPRELSNPPALTTRPSRPSSVKGSCLSKGTSLGKDSEGDAQLVCSFSPGATARCTSSTAPAPGA